jgi:hypothetical protein
MSDAKDTTARTRILHHWNTSISDALSRRDPRGLRFLQESIASTLEPFEGRILADARAILERCKAARRFLGGGRRG